MWIGGTIFFSKGDAEQIKLSQNSYIEQISDSKNIKQDSCETLIYEGFLLRIAQKYEKSDYTVAIAPGL